MAKNSVENKFVGCIVVGNVEEDDGKRAVEFKYCCSCTRTLNDRKFPTCGRCFRRNTKGPYFRWKPDQPDAASAPDAGDAAPPPGAPAAAIAMGDPGAAAADVAAPGLAAPGPGPVAPPPGEPAAHMMIVDGEHAGDI
jgi:hypothetical protein